LRVTLPPGYRIAGEMCLPAAEVWPSSAESFILQVPEIIEQNEVTALQASDTGNIVELPPLAANHFRIFRIKR
jgi:hypothetical protein